jgi:hypothetical protein
MYVDNELAASAELPAGVAAIDVMRPAPGGLFIGSVPNGGGSTSASLQPFKGCIKDIVINEQ